MTLYFFAVWTQSGESGNTLKIKCSGTADERANIFPCQQRAKPSAVANVRWATQCLTLTKQAFRKDDRVERQPTTLAHSTANKKPRRHLRGNALGIVSPSGLRPRLNGIAAKARRRCRNAPINLYILTLPFLQLLLWLNLRQFPLWCTPRSRNVVPHRKKHNKRMNFGSLVYQLK